jgi:hypothetical protein
MPTLRVDGCVWSAQRVPTTVNLGFLDRNRYFFIQVAPRYPNEAEWNPFQTHYLSDNLVGPEIELGISGPVARNSGH